MNRARTAAVGRRLLLVMVLVILSTAVLPVIAAAADSTGRYIVVLKDSVSNSGAVASEHARKYGSEVGFVYSHALKGYSATIPSSRLPSVRSDSRVAYVEPDGVATLAQALPWGIDKIDADVSSTKAGDGSGVVGNVNVYVIDTGVDTAHPDLSVVNHVNFAGGPNKDCHGHGTHVAGTVAAKDNSSDVVGVAPGAPVTGVKVLSCSGSGSWSGVIKGVDWVTANAKKPAIANMSLGGGASDAVDSAVKKSADSGVFYAVAAGNNGEDACKSSPARAGTHNGVATVGATDQTDKEASWSNYGLCVDIWAPGVSILSTRKGGGTSTMSGTSMASPHVGGGGALWVSNHTSDSAATVESNLKASAQSPGTLSKSGSLILREYVGTY